MTVAQSSPVPRGAMPMVQTVAPPVSAEDEATVPKLGHTDSDVPRTAAGSGSASQSDKVLELQERVVEEAVVVVADTHSSAAVLRDTLAPVLHCGTRRLRTQAGAFRIRGAARGSLGRVQVPSAVRGCPVLRDGHAPHMDDHDNLLAGVRADLAVDQNMGMVAAPGTPAALDS